MEDYFVFLVFIVFPHPSFFVLSLIEDLFLYFLYFLFSHFFVLLFGFYTVGSSS